MTKQTIVLPVTGTVISSSDFGIPVKNTIDELWQGTTAGDMDYYSSATEKDRIPKGAARTALKMDATGVFPEFGSAVFCSVYNNAAQSIVKDTYVPATFTTELSDTDNFWAVGNPTILTIPYTGVYLINYQCNFAVNATGIREVWIKLGASSIIREYSAAINGASTSVNTITIRSLSAGNEISVVVWQNSGANLDLNTNSSSLSICLLG